MRARAMRVVGGELRGRHLEAPRGNDIRPTAERTREAIFSILHDVREARVLDLFAGTGALGIEALSRGAAEATFVDSAEIAVATIIANVSRLGLRERSQVVRADVRGLRPSGTFELVLADPPYAGADAFGPILTRALALVLAPGARVVVESDRRAPIELGLALALERRYGDTLVRVYKAAQP
jgi:16S rRNA (guanine966-N2)-methyltransferase